MLHNLNPSVIAQVLSSLEERIIVARRFGFDSVDLPPQLPESMAEAEAWREKVTAAGLVWGLFSMPTDALAGQEPFERAITQLPAMMPLIAATGCRDTYLHLWPGSDVRESPAQASWTKDRLRVLAAMLGEYGLRIGIEWIGPKTLRDRFKYPFVHRLDQLLELIDGVEPEVGVVIDTFHWWTSGGTLDELRNLPAQRIVNVHVNDAVAGRARDEQLDGERAMPLSQGVIDAAAVLQTLAREGYRGPVICEPFMPAKKELGGLAPHEAAARVAVVMEALFEKAGIKRSKHG